MEEFRNLDCQRDKKIRVNPLQNDQGTRKQAAGDMKG